MLTWPHINNSFSPEKKKKRKKPHELKENFQRWHFCRGQTLVLDKRYFLLTSDVWDQVVGWFPFSSDTLFFYHHTHTHTHTHLCCLICLSMWVTWSFLPGAPSQTRTSGAAQKLESLQRAVRSHFYFKDVITMRFIEANAGALSLFRKSLTLAHNEETFSHLRFEKSLQVLEASRWEKEAARSLETSEM